MFYDPREGWRIPEPRAGMTPALRNSTGEDGNIFLTLKIFFDIRKNILMMLSSHNHNCITVYVRYVELSIPCSSSESSPSSPAPCQMHLEKQQMRKQQLTVQGLRPLPPTWHMWTKFLVPGFALTQT